MSAEHGPGTAGRPLVVVEPVEGLGRAFVDQASARGLVTTWCRDGAEALVTLGSVHPTALVLAACVAVVPAHTVVELVRARWAYPVLVGAGPGDDAAVARALRSGATGTVARPYDLDEVLGRTLLLSREPEPLSREPEPLSRAPEPASREPEPHGRPDVLVAGPVLLDLRRHEVRLHGREVRLTEREMDLLAHLVARRGEVSSQDEISHAVWGGPTTTNTVAVHVNRIRAKLGDDPRHGALIRTVRGVGYRLAPTLCDPAPSVAGSRTSA